MKFSIVIEDVDSEKDRKKLIRLMEALTGADDDSEEHDGEEGEENEEQETSVDQDMSQYLVATATQKPERNGKPVRLVISGLSSPTVDSWKSALVETAELMIEAQRLPRKTLFMGKSYIPLISVNRLGKRPTVQLSNGLYLDVSCSAKDIVRRCAFLVTECGYPAEALTIYYELL